MNNGFLHIKSNNSRITTTKLGTDQSLRTSLIHNTDQNTSIDLTDVSILSVGLTRYQHRYNHGMLTDDDEDNEVV
jgi:hypothetical protein